NPEPLEHVHYAQGIEIGVPIIREEGWSADVNEDLTNRKVLAYGQQHEAAPGQLIGEGAPVKLPEMRILAVPLQFGQVLLLRKPNRDRQFEHKLQVRSNRHRRTPDQSAS